MIFISLSSSENGYKILGFISDSCLSNYLNLMNSQTSFQDNWVTGPSPSLSNMKCLRVSVKDFTDVFSFCSVARKLKKKEKLKNRKAYDSKMTLEGIVLIL